MGEGGSLMTTLPCSRFFGRRPEGPSSTAVTDTNLEVVVEGTSEPHSRELRNATRWFFKRRIKQMGREFTDCGEILAKHVLDKGFVPRKSKGHLWLNNK